MKNAIVIGNKNTRGTIRDIRPFVRTKVVFFVESNKQKQNYCFSFRNLWHFYAFMGLLGLQIEAKRAFIYFFATTTHLLVVPKLLLYPSVRSAMLL